MAEPVTLAEAKAVKTREMAAALNQRSAWLPGKRVKLDFGDDGVVLLDGVAGRATEEDGAATDDPVRRRPARRSHGRQTGRSSGV